MGFYASSVLVGAPLRHVEGIARVVQAKGFFSGDEGLGLTFPVKILGTCSVAQVEVPLETGRPVGKEPLVYVYMYIYIYRQG